MRSRNYLPSRNPDAEIGKFIIGLGTGDLSTDSLARLNRLEEFGITFENVLPYAFKHYNDNAINSFEENKKLCWQFLPDEPSGVTELDNWGFHSNSVEYRDLKREKFILNSEKIETDFASLMEEISIVYGDSFYLIGIESNNEVKVSAIDEVMTCLHYWK